MLVIYSLPSGRELQRSRVTVCLCVRACVLGYLHIALFANLGLYFKLVQVSLTSNPQVGQKLHPGFGEIQTSGFS